MRATVIVVVVLVLALPAVCGAAPSIRGYTGVMMTPNTEVAAQDTIEVGAHAFGIDNLLGIPNLDADSTTFLANVGVTKGLEATLAVRALDIHIPEVIPVQTDQTQVALHLKYQFLKEPDDPVGLAVGMTDVFEQWDNLFFEPMLHDADIGFYGVVSKNFSDLAAGDPPLRVNVGLLFSKEPLFADNVWHLIPMFANDTQFFGSVEAGLSDEVMLMAELAGDSLNYQVRITPDPKVKLDIGFVDAYGTTDLFWGGSYCWTW